jgi:hypothetical protein
VDFVICRLFTRLPPVLQDNGHGCVLMYEIWWIFLHYIFKIVYLLKNVLWMEDLVYSYCHRYTKKVNCRTRHWWKTKRKKSAKWISTVQRTQEPHGMTLRNHTNSILWMLVVTSTLYHEWPRSHQLRTMNERGHTNSVLWMNAVTLTPYHECTQFVDSGKQLLFRPIAYIHGTELVWQHSFMDRVDAIW